MRTQMESVQFNTPIFSFFRHSIDDINGNPILTVKPKLALRPKYYFYKDSQLLFYGVLTISKNIFLTRFKIYDNNNKNVAIVSEKPIHQKSQVFKEYTILIGDEEYEVKYTFAYRKFLIRDKTDNVCAEGKIVSSFFRNLFHLRRYRVNVYDNEHDLNLWLAIIKGMQELE